MDNERSVRLAREALYNLVWLKPLNKLAAELGISSAALTKQVDLLEVPRPPQGYWQQLALGQSPPRRALPAASEGTPLELVIAPSSSISKSVAPAPSVPTIQVARTLSKPHPVVSAIQQHLVGGHRDHGQKTIYGGGHAVIRVGPETELRALRILDALFSGLSKMGHEVRLRPDSEARGRFILEALLWATEPVSIRLVEPLRRSDHVMSKEEKGMLERYKFSFAHKYDYTPSGKLELEADKPWRANVRSRWADGKKDKLEDLLGEVAVGLELVASAHREERERREKEREIEIETKRREEKKRRTFEHQRALGDALVKAARTWQEAELVRTFLNKLDECVPKSERSAEFETWFEWAKGYATKLDPTSTPHRLVRALEL